MMSRAGGPAPRRETSSAHLRMGAASTPLKWMTRIPANRIPECFEMLFALPPLILVNAIQTVFCFRLLSRRNNVVR
jgi:hypothetical protein